MNIAFYDNYWNTAKQLSDEQRLRFFDAICEYAFEGIVPDFGDDVTLTFGFGFIRPNIDSSIKAFNDGKKGGRPGRPRKARDDEKTLKRVFENPLNPPLNQQNRTELNRTISKMTASGRQTKAVCPDCGGEVIKSNCSPNWSCKTCRQIYTPQQVAFLSIKEGELE